MDIQKGRVDNAFLRQYGETAIIANSSTTYTADVSTGNTFEITMTGNCTFTFTNPLPAGNHCAFTMMLVQDATAGRTATWPTSVVWPAGIAPALVATRFNTDVFTFTTYDGGSNWYGLAVAQNMQVAQTWIKFGYFGGGYAPGARSTVDRIDYSNDTATAIAKGPLSSVRQTLAATGTSAFGYFGGGYAPSTSSSTVDRIDYSNDTATAVAKGPLSAGRYDLAATGVPRPPAILVEVVFLPLLPPSSVSTTATTLRPLSSRDPCHSHGIFSPPPAPPPLATLAVELLARRSPLSTASTTATTPQPL